jgi:2-hydroxy-3-keto-5-methylthiopentenyl-1-phosphate phosphatase
MRRPGYLKALPIFSNRLERTDGGFKALFPDGPVCEHGCATCKAALIKKLTSAGDQVLFVGDGLSDRYAAEVANVTFAKGKLLEHCRQKGLACVEYKDFKKVTEWLSDNHAILKKAVFK